MDADSSIRTPLLLSQICPKWRETALATPRLWNRLFLQITPNATAVLTELVQTWLTRSSGCPLKAYVFWEEPPVSISHPVLDLLADHCERWQTMFFYMPYIAFKGLTRIRKRLPLLRELSIGTQDDEPPSSEHIGKIDVFSHAPRLRSLEGVNFCPLIFKFPWSHITHVPMMEVTIDEAIDVLLQTANLAEGHFIFVGGARAYGQRVRVQHETLRNFTIMTPPRGERVDLRALFPQLSFPRLEELRICNLQSPFCAEFIAFLGRLRGLQTLHLRKAGLTDAQLVQGLAQLPSLTALIVYATPGGVPIVTDELLAALTWRPHGARNLLPLLAKLELTVDYNVASAFVDMVRSRVRPAEAGPELCADCLLSPATARALPDAYLESIRIRPTEDLGDAAYTGLAEVASCGVEITVEDLM